MRPVFSRQSRRIALPVAFGGALLMSCTFSPGPAGSTAPSTGSATGTGNVGAGTSSGTAGAGPATGATGTSGATGTTGPSATGPNCGLMQYGLQNVPPDLLLILDKSGSMANQPDDTPCMGGGATCETKWGDMAAGLNMVVTQTATTIRWGLKFFSSNNGCGVNQAVDVPVGPNNAAAIDAAINMTMPGGDTPTALAIDAGVAYLMGLTDTNPKYILLATDGEPNCAMAATGGRYGGRYGGGATQDDSAGAEAAVTAAATAGFPVFVVGVGNVTPAIATLDQLAINGGRPQPTEPRYYPVASTTDLVSVLGTIGGQIASCTFSLGKVPPDPTNIGVYAMSASGTTKLAESATNGWQYGAGMTSIELTGAACDAVKSKTTTDVQAIFGCPGQVIP
jgi:von Willebrand factor type A domain-containing protein